MAATVHLMPSAKRKLAPYLHEQVQREIALVFPQAVTVTAFDVLTGFQSNQQKKLILAVQTEGRPEDASHRTFECHMVKLGERDEVIADAEQWKACIQERQVAQRMFVSVRSCELSGQVGRAAVVYQDAGQWYGLLTPDEQVASLAWAVEKAVFTNEIEVAAVERVICQIFRELGRYFYDSARDGQEEQQHTAIQADQDYKAMARTFFRGKLKLDEQRPAVHKWQDDELLTLRRDVDWLLCGSMSPAGNAAPDYLDPFDYVLWALEHDAVPATLVGPSHGDLHAGNVIVGVAGSEVEYPLLIDYGDMALDNVVVWDFAKFETELKVRMLAKLFESAAVRDSVWGQVRSRHFQRFVDLWSRRVGNDVDPLSDRTQQIVFAFEFERRLAERTAQIFRSPRQPETHGKAAYSPLDRALSILGAVRCQVAIQLGRSKNRAPCWRDEFDMAVAAYGLNTAKFSDDAYPIYQRLFALVSAGVAAARLSSGRGELTAPVAPLVRPAADWPSYHAPLRAAYSQWKSNAKLEEAEKLLADIAGRFDYAVPFRRERALLLSKLGRLDEALRLVENIAAPRGTNARAESHGDTDIVELCVSFLEVEVLSRIGRIYKDKADACWEILGIPFNKLQNHTAAQFYRSAYNVYRKAFELSHTFYPGGNAVVAGLLAGEGPAVVDIAHEVATECKTFELDAQPALDRYWAIATEGDMALILDEGEKAAGFYRAAIDELPPGNEGMVQCTYDQLCRLYKALGEKRLRRALDVFRQTTKFKLQKGPLGDCDGLTASRSPPP